MNETKSIYKIQDYWIENSPSHLGFAAWPLIKGQLVYKRELKYYYYYITNGRDINSSHETMLLTGSKLYTNYCINITNFEEI